MATKRKAPMSLAKPRAKQSAKAQSRIKIDETKTAVTTGDFATPDVPSTAAEPIEISSGSSSEYESDGDNDAAEAQPTEATSEPIAQQDGENADTEMALAEEHDKEASEDEAPTLGDMVRFNTTVDVSAALPNHSATSQALAVPRTKNMVPVNVSSIGTVLEQALRTDDNDLLESCLHVSDHEIVMNTIKRMNSSLAGTLLQKLAIRLHRRPGRALSLLKWAQLTLITHGGALVMRADLVESLRDLNRVLDERSKGLSGLLMLKGKLDMLDAQLKARKANKEAAANGRRREFLDERGEDIDEEEEGVIYVEGEENDGAGQARSADEEDEDVPMLNGGADSDGDSDDDDYEGSDDSDGLEGEELADGNEVDHDDVEEESGEDESDAEAARPPAKMRKTAASFSSKKK